MGIKWINGQRPLEAKRWPRVFMISVIILVCGCVRSVPSLPEQREANTKQFGILGLQSASEPPTVLYQRPPKGFVDGLIRGTKRGAVIGAHVGIEVAKFFVLAGPEVSKECVRTYSQGGWKCYGFILLEPIVGLLALIAIPPAVTTAAGIQGGFTSYSRAEVEKWEKALVNAQDVLQIQATMREAVRYSLASCCSMFPPPSRGEASAYPHSSNAGDITGVDTVLETDVLELGLAEATSEELAGSIENTGTINPNFTGAVAPLNAIFQKSRTSLYMLVQTKLLKINDNALLDERKFGYLSTPRSYLEWTEDNAVQFRTELLAAYQKLADQIIEKVVRSALSPNRENQAY